MLFLNIEVNAKELFHKEIRHYFSSSKMEDTFILSVKGKNIFDSFVTFKILSRKGKVIYLHRFSMGDFRDYGFPPPQRDSTERASITDELNHFLDEAHFRIPAISDTSKYSVNMKGYSVSRAEWLEISEDHNSIGFYYILGSEDGYSIAYSKKHNKVIIYYKCC
jgi:hypothetical protein